MTGRTEPLRDDVIRAWRLSITAATEAGGVRLGEFNWPWALGLALDEVDQLRVVVAAVEELARLWATTPGTFTNCELMRDMGRRMLERTAALGAAGSRRQSDEDSKATPTPEATTDERPCRHCGHYHQALCLTDNPHLDCDCPPVTGHPTGEPPTCEHDHRKALEHDYDAGNRCRCCGIEFGEIGGSGICPGPAGRLVPQRDDEARCPTHGLRDCSPLLNGCSYFTAGRVPVADPTKED